MRETDAARMQMQLVVYAFRHVPIPMILFVSQDGVTDDRHVGAKLVLSPGYRFQRQEGDRLTSAVYHGVIGHGRLGSLLLAGSRLAHAVALRPGRLHQRRL